MLAESAAGAYVLLTVSDNGRGMDDETLSRIFEPFFTTKSAGKARGLGLPTVYGAVKQNGGFIEVQSAPGSGSTFTIYLPRHEGAPLKMPSPTELQDHAGGDETILLVEDDPAILELTSSMLQRLGYTVVAAGTPGTALEIAQNGEKRIDLVLTDMVMSEMHGRELAERLQQLLPGLKMLFMSGYTDSVITQHGVLAEGVHFLQKPFSRKALATQVRQTLDDGLSNPVPTQPCVLETN